MQRVADVRVLDSHAPQFSADLDLYTLPRTSVFSLGLPSTRVLVPEGSGFVSVNLIKQGHIQSYSSKKRRVWDSSAAYVVHHDRHHLEFTSSEDLITHAFCFDQSLLLEYARVFQARDEPDLEEVCGDFVLESKAGGCFTRYAEFVWNALSNKALSSCLRGVEEIEDSLWALLLAAIQRQQKNRPPTIQGYARKVRIAEDYILGKLADTIRVSDIASEIQVSVPTLNRAFRAIHGMGPKAFVKARRLESVRRDLMQADSQVTSVTDIATKYSFWHLGQFSIDYRNSFDELPSETLRRTETIVRINRPGFEPKQ